MSTLSPDRWRAVSPHLDRALQIPARERLYAAQGDPARAGRSSRYQERGLSEE